MNKKKWIVPLLILIVAACLVTVYVWLGSPAPSSAKWIEKCFKYDIENEYWQFPPVVGLEVDFGQGNETLWTKTTNGLGCVKFGSGLPDGTYWLGWTFGGESYREEVSINCSQLVWHFENLLPAKEEGVRV